MKRKGVTIILTLTLLAVLFYGYRYLKIPVETKTAVMTRLEDTIRAKAYVIRTEEVFQADITGTMYNFAEEGDRVSKNMCISTVYQGNVDADLITDLNNVNNRIQKLQEAKEKNEQFITDSGSGDYTVEKVKADIVNAVINGNIQDVEGFKNTLKALNHEEADEFDSGLNELIDKRENIEARLSNDKSDINTTMSGIFSLNVDGYEEILTPESIFEYKVNDFNSLNEPERSQRTSNLVSAGESICKVVDNHVWYAMAVMPIAEATQIKQKGSVIVRFDSLPGAEVRASVAYVSAEEEGSENAVVVLKSDRYLEGVYGMRSGDMEIVINRYVGYEIPIHSLRVIEEKTGVVISGGSSEIFCECDVVYSNETEGIAIVYPSENAKRKLAIGDKIVLGEKK